MAVGTVMILIISLILFVTMSLVNVFDVTPALEPNRAWMAVAVVVGIFQGVLIISLLVTRSRRRKAELDRQKYQALAEAGHNRLEEVVGNVPVVVWESSIDPKSGERRLRFISEYVEKMLGYSVDEWLSNPDMGLSVIVDEDRDMVLREIESVVNDGQAKTVEYRWLAKNGKTRWVEANILPVLDSTGNRTGFRGVNIDITERKGADEALRQSEARFRHMADTAPVLIWMSDVDPLITYVNQRCLDFTGLSVEQFMGTGWLDTVHEDDRKRSIDIGGV